jgi:hypothetical protein
MAIMRNLTHRLIETVADTNEDVQGYVADLLLTLHMNATLFVQQLNTAGETTNDDILDWPETTDVKPKQPEVLQLQKKKSRSLQASKKQQQQDEDLADCKALVVATAAAMTKRKSATVSAHVRHFSEEQTAPSSQRARLDKLLIKKSSLHLLDDRQQQHKVNSLKRHEHSFGVN